MPHGFTWGLMLLKDLPKPPIPVTTYMSKKKKIIFESMLGILRVQYLMDLFRV